MGGDGSRSRPASAPLFLASRMRATLADDVRAAAASAVGSAPPGEDRHVDRLRVSVAANADARTIREALRRAIAAELGRKR